jgi:hypothetical protein
MIFPACEPRFGKNRQILGSVAYARHMHELDGDEREAKAILRRTQLRVVAGTAFNG